MILALFACTDAAPSGETDKETGEETSEETGETTPDSTDTEDTGPTGVDDAPGVWRFGPPAPSVGIYGLAAHPDGDWIYVSNLHVPWITVIDPATGGWADALSLVDEGVESPSFPLLAVTERTLWATAFDQDLLMRWDVDTHAPLAPVTLPAPGTTIEEGRDGLWVGLEDRTAVRFVGDGVAETVALPMPPDALSVTETDVAWMTILDGQVGIVGRDGTERWHTTVTGTLQDVLLVDQTVFVTDRVAGDVIALRDGAEVGRAHTGSDTFALYWDGAHLLVTNRQGAELPPSGAYEGAPGLITALTLALEPVWTLPLDRTVHFLAWDGGRWWAANEDALRMSAFTPDGVEVLRGPRVGMTLDSLRFTGQTLVAPSHLTDEVWLLDDTARKVDTCGWPLVGVAAPDGTTWVPCQMAGDVMQLFSDGTTATTDIAATFHTNCGDDTLCTGHDWLLDAAWYDDQLWWTDPYLGAVRAWDGTILPFDTDAERADHVQHLALVAGTDLYAFEPRDQRVYDLQTGNTFQVTTPTADFALVGNNPLYVGSSVLDVALNELGTLPGTAVAAGHFVYVLDGWSLIVVDGTTEVGRLDLHDLRVPPDPAPDGAPRPMRFVEGPDGALWVANVMKATVERRDAETLAPLGSDEIRPVGTWAELDGLR